MATTQSSALQVASIDELSGRSESHLVSLANGQRVHRLMLESLRALQLDASAAGFDLTVVSGFRSFDRQLSIWNGKASGSRVVNDSQGQPLDLNALANDWERVQAILRWSALPGCSRHHWGTDIDVVDANALPADYALQLTQAESATLFADFHRWLDTQMAAQASQGFYRPYAVDRGGIAPEPWHLSYQPLASGFAQQLTSAQLRQILADTELCFKATVLEHWDTIYSRFVAV